MLQTIDQQRIKVLEHAINQFRLDTTSPVFLGGFHNWVYETRLQDQTAIMRISHEPFHPPELILGEVLWIKNLTDQGVAACKPVPSPNGNLVEVLEVDGKKYPTVFFEKALGNPPNENDWNDTLFETMGQTIGKMHRLTRDYCAPKEATSPTWKDSLKQIKEYMTFEDREIAAKFQEILDYPKSLTVDRDSYGLVHADVHAGNFFVNNGQIMLFDFQDCHYSWFVEDLAMALFYAIFTEYPRGMDPDYPTLFWKSLLTGYKKENHLDKKWLNEIPYFIRQREIALYIVLTAKGADHWFLQNRREDILADRSIVNVSSLW
ncbi:phosphotransferase enzyme family protein [Risungbinella massiliensis]|uniref:phosphotransferase enzyme family protein n=1 Tax=Risungbinella massiliensis TaxID=1329796 RepID=UPI0005CC7754|nr:phosphotransferase [Risungbinella massiliensis]